MWDRCRATRQWLAHTEPEADEIRGPQNRGYTLLALLTRKALEIATVLDGQRAWQGVDVVRDYDDSFGVRDLVKVHDLLYCHARLVHERQGLG